MTISQYSGWFAWILVTLILLSRPLAQILKLKILYKLTLQRKLMGWICGIGVLVHVFLYIYLTNKPLTFFFDLKYWNFGNFMGWGLLAFVTLLPVFITSNKFSMLKLKRNWKRIQQLTYIFFIASGVHIYLVNRQWYYTLLPMGIWLILWVWAKVFIAHGRR